jgi:hypothetical protein
MKPARPTARWAVLPRAPDLELFPTLDRGWPADGMGPVTTILSQLPDPTELRPGALVVVRDAGKPPQGLRRLARGVQNLWRKMPRAHAAVRCTALLARGYRDIGARLDPRTGEALVWGFAAATSGRSS